MTDGPRLGREFGSVNNWIMSGQGKDAAIEPGDGCTILLWSDRRAGTVVDVRGNKRRTITIQRDDEKLIGGKMLSEHQEYAFTRNPDAPLEEVTFRQGAWRTKGGSVVHFGHRACYRDPSF